MDMQEIEAMTDRELLAKWLTITSPGFRGHEGRTLMLRIGRWGTCVDCPVDAKGKHPENCVHTDRYDHNIHSTRHGKFFEYKEEISKAKLIKILLG